MKEDTLRRLSTLIARLFARDLALRGSERFREDLGLDSLDLVRLQVCVEDAWEIRFDPVNDDLAAALTTVGALVSLIESKRRGDPVP